MSHLIYAGIAEERSRQDEKWGLQRHRWAEWIAVLGEEHGEACQEALRLTFDPDLTNPCPAQIQALRSFRRELIQVAAVAVAMIEHVDEELSKR